MKKLLLFLIVTGMFASCDPYRKISLVRGIGEEVDYTEDTVSTAIPDPVLKIGDLMIIMVNHPTEPASVAAFNLPWMPAQGLGYMPGGALSAGGGSLQSYLIDTEGYITFPTLGKIQIAGMTKNELNDYLIKALYPKYMDVEPIITIRFANFKITIIDEQGGHSGNYSIANERISIFEAIAMAGGLSLHARRDNVLLIRETVEGKKTFRIDIRDKNLMQSPYYWLQQNDVLYFHADPQSARSTYFGQVENMFLGILSAAMSTASFTISMISYFGNKSNN